LQHYGCVRVERNSVAFRRPQLEMRVKGILAQSPDGRVPCTPSDGVWALEKIDCEIPMPKVADAAWQRCSAELLAAMPNLSNERLRKIIRRVFSFGEVRKAMTEFRTDVNLLNATVIVRGGASFLQVIVKPRMITSETYVVRIALQNSNDMSETLVTKSSHCTCPAGQSGSCHHIGAVLFSISAVQRGNCKLADLAAPAGDHLGVKYVHEFVPNMFDTVFIRPSPAAAAALLRFRKLHACLPCARGSVLAVQVAGANGHAARSMEATLRPQGLWSASMAATGATIRDVQVEAMIEKAFGTRC
jgi:hypothetical protein